MYDSEKGLAAAIIKEWEQLSGNRGTWESHWQEIADRMYPSMNRNFVTHQNLTKGDKRNSQLFDSTAALALNKFSAILDSLLTPVNQKWHRLVSSDDDLNKNRDVKLWFDNVNRVLFKQRYAPKANFASQNQLNFKSLGAFGSGALYIDPLASEPGLRYKNVHLGEAYFVENHQGIVDKVIRNFPMTARQIHQRWPNSTPDKIMTALEQNGEKEFHVLHYVGPRENQDLSKDDFRGMPHVSYYLVHECQEILEEGGYTTFPYAVSRYEQSPNEVYGRSPAMEVLPSIKTLNEQKKTLLKQGHRAVDPVLLVHDDGILDTFSMKPGHANAGGVTKDGRPLVHTLPSGRVDIGRDMMEDERALINESFLVTLFQILVETPTMTATEVMERAKEKGMLLAPTLGRQQSERLGPQIERELDILAAQNLLPDMPPILVEAGADFKVEYDSPLSRVQRAEEASGLMRTIEMTLNYVNVTGDSSPLDHYNMDAIVPELADINAVPTKWLNSKEEIMNLRNQRAEAAKEEKMIQAGPSMAAMAKAGQQGG